MSNITRKTVFSERSRRFVSGKVALFEKSSLFHPPRAKIFRGRHPPMALSIADQMSLQPRMPLPMSLPSLMAASQVLSSTACLSCTCIFGQSYAVRPCGHPETTIPTRNPCPGRVLAVLLVGIMVSGCPQGLTASSEHVFSQKTQVRTRRDMKMSKFERPRHGSMVARWWLDGGSMVARWWLDGGSRVARWWLDGGSRCVRVFSIFRKPTRRDIRELSFFMFEHRFASFSFGSLRFL